MTTTGSAHVDRLHQHVHAFFSGHAARRRDFDRGPIQKVLPGFHVLEVSPGPRSELWTYVSIGASFNDDAESRLEFFMMAAQPSERHVEMLAMVAHYHRTGQRLGLGHTFGIGEPWLAESALDCVLVSKPYPYGPDLEVLNLDENHLHLLWLLPITSEERTYAVANGLEAIETLFEQSAIRYWDSNRQSVV